MIAILCPHCRGALSIPDEAAALPVNCTACAASFAVGIPIAAAGAEWLEPAPEREVESLPLHLRFQNKQRAASRGVGIFPAMALLFAIVVPFGIAAVLVTAEMQKPKPKTAPTAGEELPEAVDPLHAGERKLGGAPPVVEYKSMADDPTLLPNLDLALPSPKAEPAPPLFRGAKPKPKPKPDDSASTPKPPPP